MDLFWIKTLASSKLVDGRWQLGNVNEVKRNSKKSVERAVHELYHELNFAVGAFNEHIQREKKLYLCSMEPDTQGYINGFVLLLDQVKLRLERSGGKIIAVLESTEGFRRQIRQQYTFEARFDAFGGLSWFQDRRMVLTSEAIAKQLLHDFWSLALSENSKEHTI